MIASNNYGNTWQFLSVPTGVYSDCGSDVGNDGHILAYGNHLYLVTDEGVVYKMDSTDTHSTENYCLPYDIWASSYLNP